MTITSAQNPKIQRIKRLQSQPKERRAEGAFVIEGVRLVEEALQANWPIEALYYTEESSGRGQALVREAAMAGVHVEPVAPFVLAAASDTETQQGILAVATMRALPLPEQLNLVLVPDGMRDPGNLGTLLRTAEAAGVQAVLLPPGSADPYAPKVLRAGMGAHFRLPVLSLDWPELGTALAGLTVYLAAAGEGAPYTKADFCRPLALIVGGEAEGAGPQARAMAQELVHIPMPGRAESLNASIAAAVLLFEALRQRSAAC